MPTLVEKSAALDELERRHGASLELDELRRRYALPEDEIDGTKIKADIPAGDNLIDKQPSYRRIYEDILSGKEDWDSYIPANKRTQLQAAFPNNYEENSKRLVNSAYFADQLGIDIESAYITHDQLANTLLKEKTPGRAFERIKNRFNNGRVQVQVMDMGYNLVLGRGDEEETLKAIERLRGQLTPDARQDLRNLGEQMMGATAEQLPFMWEAIKASPWGAASGGLIGALMATVAGQAGPQVATLEEVVTVPAGTMLGIKVGGGLAAANRIRQLEAGGMYLELLDMKDDLGRKIDPRIAKVTAHAVGVINGGIELAEWAIILSTFGIGTKVFEKAASKATAKLFAKGTLKQIAAKYALKFSVALSGEVLQENWQESNNIVFGELAKAINNETKGTDIKHITKEELLNRYYQITTESLKGFPLLLAPGTIISGAREVVTRPKAAKKGAPVVEGPAEAPMAPKAPEAKVEPVRAKKVDITKPFVSDTSKVSTKEDKAKAEEEEKKFKVEPGEGKYKVYEVGEADTEAFWWETNNKEAADAFAATYSESMFTMGTFEVRESLEEVEFTPQEKADLAQLEALPTEEYKPSGRKPTKAVREFLTPGSTVEKVVAESKALQAAMKKAAQAARKAFVEGKKTGIAKAKQHYADLKAAEKARKELKSRIGKAVKRITKKPSKTVGFFYREAIEVLQQGIDPKFRAKKTLAQRQKTREFLERATPEQLKDFPQKLARKLAQKDLAQYTVEELEQIAADITKLEKIGRTKKKARLAVEKATREKNVTQLTKSAAKVAPIEPAPKGIDFSGEGILEAMKAGYLWTLRMPRIFDWLDGKKGTFGGLWHRLFYDQVNQLTNAELTQTDSRTESGASKMKELGITVNDLTEVTDFSELQNGLALTTEQQMGIYAGLKNRLSTDAIVNGNKITLKAANAVVTNLAQKYKGMADFVIEEYGEHYNKLRQAHIEATDTDLGQEDFYTAMIRLEKNDHAVNADMTDQLLQRHGLKRGYAAKGFTIDRKVIAPEHQKPIDIRLVSVWQSQVAKQEHYIHFAKPLQNLRKMLSDKEVKKAVEETLGKQGWGLIDNYLSRVANPSLYNGFDGGLRTASRTLRGNVATAYLALNLMTLGKQIPSLILYAKDAGPAALMSSMTDFAQNPRQMWDMVREKDPQVKHAFIERELAELRQATASIKDKTILDKYIKITAQVGDKGMIGIKFVDGIVRTIGWNAVYQKARQQGLSEAESIRLAQNATLRTQPAAAAKDVAQLYATDEILNWFTMFTNQLNNLWNITTYDTFAYWSNKKYQDVAMSLMAVSLNALAIWMLVNKKLPEDEDDLLDVATDQVLNMLPLVGAGAMTGKRGWGTVTPPPIEAVIATTAILSAKDKEKAATEALEKSLVLTGAPVVAIKRTGKFLETGKAIELIGGRKKEKKISF